MKKYILITKNNLFYKSNKQVKLILKEKMNHRFNF